MNPIINILLLSFLASLGTGLGGLIGIVQRPGKRMFGFLMGITAGVMISLSFLELVNQAWEMAGYLTATIGFALGASLMFLMDVLIPHVRFGETEGKKIHGILKSDCEDDKEQSSITPGRRPRLRRRYSRHHWFRNTSNPVDPRLLKTGFLVAIGIAIHNAPEGIAVGAGYMHAPSFGLFIAVAITLHNIPEGIATALPLCRSGISRWDAFRTALISGLTEPVGALFAALFLSAFSSLVPGALAFAGGVMTFITLDELIPLAREHGHQHMTALGIITGAIFVFLLSGIFGV